MSCEVGRRLARGRDSVVGQVPRRSQPGGAQPCEVGSSPTARLSTSTRKSATLNSRRICRSTGRVPWRIGSCTTCGFVSDSFWPRVRKQQPSAARTFLTQSLCTPYVRAMRTPSEVGNTLVHDYSQPWGPGSDVPGDPVEPHPVQSCDCPGEWHQFLRSIVRGIRTDSPVQ